MSVIQYSSWSVYTACAFATRPMTPQRGNTFGFLQTQSVTISSYGYTGDKSVLPLKNGKEAACITKRAQLEITRKTKL